MAFSIKVERGGICYVATFDEIGGIEVRNVTMGQSVYLQPGDDANAFKWEGFNEKADESLWNLCEQYQEVMTYDKR